MSSAGGNDKLSIHIREMVESDLPAVMAIEREVFPDPWPQSAFREQISGRGWGALVAEIDHRVIGYACYFTVDCEAHLTNIAVGRQDRRKSVAGQLLKAIFGIVRERGCDYVVLEVRASNTDARAFYDRFGFRLLYRRPYYYRQPVEDALVLVCYMKASDKE